MAVGSISVGLDAMPPQLRVQQSWAHAFLHFGGRCMIQPLGLLTGVVVVVMPNVGVQVPMDLEAE